MEPTKRWRELLDYRAAEAIAVLGAVPGVRGLIVGGSMGRGDPWPLSDIDLLPIYASDSDPALWSCNAMPNSSTGGRHPAEPKPLISAGWPSPGRGAPRCPVWPEGAAERMGDWRWFHGIDKAVGGRAAADLHGLAQAFLDWINAVRFAPQVITARIQRWWQQAGAAQRQAAAAIAGQDQDHASAQVREAAGALRHVLIEGWGERLGSMGREGTRFERMAEHHDATSLAARITDLCGASPAAVARRAELAPVWLKERIDLALAARRLVGEQVTAEQNARDQLLAFATYVVRRRPDLAGPWIGGAPIPALEEAMAELEAIMATLRPNEHLSEA
jgi:hypothetical protein